MMIYVVSRNVSGESCDYLMKGMKEWAFLNIDHALDKVWALINDYNNWAKEKNLDSSSFEAQYLYYPWTLKDNVEMYNLASYPTIVTFGKIKGDPYQRYILQHCDITIKRLKIADDE